MYVTIEIMFTAVHVNFTRFHFVALRALLKHLSKIKDGIVFSMFLDYFHDDYTHSHVYARTYIHTYIKTYISYIHAYVHTFIQADACKFTHTYLHT
jgi:hypothetical protein